MSSSQRPYLVQLRFSDTDRIDRDEAERMVEYLGGVLTKDGFSFYSSASRASALEVLASVYGSQYFALVDGTGRE